ncbi:MAG: DUF6573 family protein [Isosphaeraceae bacterium]
MNDAKETYNGWTNYETWAVKLWLDNEPTSYHHWTERARSWKAEEDACGFAEELKEAVQDGNPLAEAASVYADLLSAAISDVDWLEIAESYLDDVEEEAGAEDGEGPTGGEDPGDLFGPVIFAYTRKQAIADGELLDVTETAKEAGFKVPVALTRAVWAEYVRVPEGVEGQDEAGRLWDVLCMCRFGVARGEDRDASEVLFQLHVRNDDRDGEPPLVTLKAVCGPDDDARPAVTIMQVEED